MDDRNQTIIIYDQFSDVIAKKFNNIGTRTEDIKKAFSYINKDNPKVLELGCGNGRDTQEILKYTNDYIGIDASKGMIKIAKEQNPNANFIISKSETFDFPQNIDIIFAFASLLHNSKEEFSLILEKAFNSLNDNGIFFISVKKGKYQRKEKIDEFGTRIYYDYTAEDIEKLIKDKFKTIYKDLSELRGETWLEIIIQKI